MKTKTKKLDLRKLTKTERIIYKAVLRQFPATSKESAWDMAIQGGARFQYQPK